MEAIRKAMDFGGGGGGGRGMEDEDEMDEEMLMAMVEGGGEQREKQLLEADFFKAFGDDFDDGEC